MTEHEIIMSFRLLFIVTGVLIGTIPYLLIRIKGLEDKIDSLTNNWSKTESQILSELIEILKQDNK